MSSRQWIRLPNSKKIFIHLKNKFKTKTQPGATVVPVRLGKSFFAYFPGPLTLSPPWKGIKFREQVFVSFKSIRVFIVFAPRAVTLHAYKHLYSASKGIGEEIFNDIELRPSEVIFVWLLCGSACVQSPRSSSWTMFVFFLDHFCGTLFLGEVCTVKPHTQSIWFDKM